MKPNIRQMHVVRKFQFGLWLGAVIVGLSLATGAAGGPEFPSVRDAAPHVIAEVGLTRSLMPAETFEEFGLNGDMRSFHSEIRYLETILSYGPVEDPRPIFLLANAYIAASQQDYGIAFFEQVLARYDQQLKPTERAVYLAAYALLRATYADEVSFVSRVGWVRDTFRILEEADRLTDGQNPLVKWSAGLIYAQIPGIFFKRDAAIANLTWLADHPETEPTPGFYREAYRYLADLHRAAGNTETADAFAKRSGYAGKPPSIPFSGWFVSSEEKGLRFAPSPSIEEIVPGKIFAVRGFGFSDLQFVVSKDGQHLISIDAGTQPFSMEAGLAYLRKYHANLPPLTHVLVTHAHWDHIGGHTYLRSLPSNPVFYGRGNFQGTLDRVQRNHQYTQFRGAGWKDAWVADYQPDVIVDQPRTIIIGGSEVTLIPATGGETEDALLVHFPGLEATFMGDALMPFYGEPWVEEGFIDEAVETMDSVLQLQSKHILHGHYGITILYGPEQLPVFRDAFVWLVDTTRLHIANGYAAEDIIRLNLIPPGLEEHPNSFLSYLAARDTLIARVADKMTGIWREDQSGQDPRGLDVLTSVEYGRMLTSYLNLSESEIERGLRNMLDGGDNTLALKMAVAAMHQYPDNTSLTDLRNQAADRLRSAAQFFDPFRFVVYTEIRETEHRQIPLATFVQEPD